MTKVELSKKDLLEISGSNMSPKISKILSITKSEVDTISDRKQRLFEELKNIKNFSDFDGYVEHRQVLLEKLNNFFEPELKGSSEEYKFYFNNGMGSSLDSEKYSKSELDKFRRLLIRRALLLKELTLETLKNGNFNEFLTSEEIQDFILILDLKIAETADRVYLEFDKNNDKYRKNYYDGNTLKYNGDITYGGVGKNGFIPYNSFLKANFLEKIKNIDFNRLNNKFLRDYFVKYRDLLVSGDMNYENWLELGKMEMQTWADKDSKFGIIGTMESYGLQKVTFDPEFEIFFKNPIKKLEKISSELSSKYFGEGYKMGDTKYANVEPFISSGTTSLKMILGKNFHNDLDLQNLFGVYLYIINSRMNKNEIAIKTFLDIFDGIDKIDVDELTKYKKEFVWQHEFGHNLFKGNGYKSNLEENKANLFGLLFKFDENLDRNLGQNELKTLINNLIISELRRFANNEEKFNEYTFSAKLQFNKMFELGLISWNESGKISINYNLGVFKKFLESMKDFLFITQEIYRNENKNKEMTIIKEIEENFEGDLQKITTLMKK